MRKYWEFTQKNVFSKILSLLGGITQENLKFGAPLGKDIKNIITIVTYETFLLWVRNYKRRKDSGKTRKRGRPKTLKEIRKLIVRLAKENAWGYVRILGELKKFGINRLSKSSVKNILKEHNIDPCGKRNDDTWNAYINRHFQTLWACDFFTKQVLTPLGPRVFFVLFFINIKTRKVHITGATQFIVHKTPFLSPNMNAYAESWIGTIKRECLNHFIVFGEQHLLYLINEYVKHYNETRPHSSMNNMPLEFRPNRNSGEIKCQSKLGGIIRHYYRE